MKLSYKCSAVYETRTYGATGGTEIIINLSIDIISCLPYLWYKLIPGGIFMDYIKLLVEDIHSVTMATINNEGKPITRIIDLMLYDEEGIYFLTARGKSFYKELMDQEYISLTGLKGKVSFSLSGKVKNIGSHKLDEIFLKNTYMQSIYPEDTRKALDVFCLYEASGEYFDISDPAHIKRAPITINSKEHGTYYTITDRCIHCGKCETICPQRCIHNEVIDVSQCLHCGACLEICPVQAIEFINNHLLPHQLFLYLD